eukprot:5370919-Amphidinium_carterae.1
MPLAANVLKLTRRPTASARQLFLAMRGVVAQSWVAEGLSERSGTFRLAIFLDAIIKHTVTVGKRPLDRSSIIPYSPQRYTCSLSQHTLCDECMRSLPVPVQRKQ